MTPNDADPAASTGSPALQPAIRPLVAGNWKMNGLQAAVSEALAVKEAIATSQPAADVMICPPATLLLVLSELTKGGLSLGGQDCHVAQSGAHTGDLSAEMLRDAGASAVIVGHSERRADHAETDAVVRAKAEAAHRACLIAIVCVGETEGQRRAGQTLKVIARQVANSLPDGATPDNTIIAYEPVWAIGTGLTPTVADVADVHTAIRGYAHARLGESASRMRLLYGGSVKPSNAAELMAAANVNGALVGGASLKASDFLGIIETYAT